jgi:Na+/melibiose symporter-like transporter
LTNVAVVVVALIAGAFFVPSARTDDSPTLDPVGALLSIAGLGSLIYAIIEAPVAGWLSWPTVAAFAAAAALLTAFARWELRTREPMLDLRFFRNPRFTAAASSITLIFFVMFGMIFVLTQYLQLVLGYSPLQAGVRVLPWALVYMLAAPRSARLVQRWGQRRVVSGGLAVVAAGLALLARSGLHANYLLLALALVVVAAGMAMVTAPSTGAIVSSLPLNKAGVGSAVNDTTRELGGALGVAVVGSILASLYRGDVVGRVAGLAVSGPSVATSLSAALQASAGLPPATAHTVALAARQSYVHAFDLTIGVTVVVALAASALVSWMLRPMPAEELEAADASVALEAA